MHRLYAWLLHLLPMWSFGFLHSNYTSSDLHVFFHIFNVLNEVMHQQLCPTFWFFNVSSVVTLTLTLSNVSLQHYCTSNSLHVKLNWTPLLLLIFIYCSMSHTSFASTLNHYIGFPWHEPSCPSKQHTSSLDTSSCKDASFWKDTSIIN